MNFRKLALKQLSQSLQAWQKLSGQPHTGISWIKTIRRALRITTAQLAKRLNVNRSRVIYMEHAEMRGAITLHTLKTVAQAMHCELIYAIVPKTSLDAILEAQALKLASKKVNQIAHSMALENQAVSNEHLKKQIADMVQELLTGSHKELWQEKDI